MKSESAWLLTTLIGAALVTLALMLGYVTIGGLLVVTLGAWVALRLAAGIRIDADRGWLPAVMLVAFLAKVLGSVARYVMVTDVYGEGDSLRYHRAATDMVHQWRSLQIPEGTVGSASTKFTEQVTAFLYIPAVPSLLVAFLIFSFFAFIGTVCFYVAFRRSVPADLLKPYALALFFMPSLLFWPSSIGKDSIMVFAVGLISLAAVYLFERRWMKGLSLLTPGFLLALGVRAHVAALLAAAIAVALAGARQPQVPLGPLARSLIVGVAVVALAYFGLTAADKLGLDTSSDGLQDFLVETERQTAQGGSAVTGSPVRSPLDLPEAFLRVLFRPLPGESLAPPLLIASIEGGLFLGFTLLRLPRILSNLRQVRRNPYLMYASVYCLAFVVAFSSIFNLGILARQRVQVLPLFLVVLIGLGWHRYQEDAPEMVPARAKPVALRPLPDD